MADGLCPQCGGAAPFQNPRYPDALCGDCVARLTDADGRLLRLTNVSFSGGFAAWHADDRSACASSTATGAVFLDGVQLEGRDGRFGGIVVQPVGTWAD